MQRGPVCADDKAYDYDADEVFYLRHWHEEAWENFVAGLVIDDVNHCAAADAGVP